MNVFPMLPRNANESRVFKDTGRSDYVKEGFGIWDLKSVSQKVHVGQGSFQVVGGWWFFPPKVSAIKKDELSLSRSSSSESAAFQSGARGLGLRDSVSY